MEESEEVKALRQDIDALSEQISILVENAEVRHAEIIAKLEFLEERIADSKADELAGHIAQTMAPDIEELKQGMQGIAEAVKKVQESLEEFEEEEE